MKKGNWEEAKRWSDEAVKTAHENYAFYTGKASGLVRQLALGGIAVVWLFSLEPSSEGTNYKLPSSLAWPLYLMVLSLAADFLHYMISAGIWGWRSLHGVANFRKLIFWHYRQTPEGRNRRDFWVEFPSHFLFWLKSAFVLIGYIWLLIAMPIQFA
ncbi:MAG TPA: hypothetical protein DEA96_03285 [Leptospiraceae bacterium]|nr:hypothetical protein [Spirochaetaceae bacterium]HBS03963.1 hypothetical protein [Leptospiraceae bacterium]